MSEAELAWLRGTLLRQLLELEIHFRNALWEGKIYVPDRPLFGQAYSRFGPIAARSLTDFKVVKRSLNDLAQRAAKPSA